MFRINAARVNKMDNKALACQSYKEHTYWMIGRLVTPDDNSRIKSIFSYNGPSLKAIEWGQRRVKGDQQDDRINYEAI